MDSPRLPWEILERVIGHSGSYPNLLRSFTLTCRDLVPRSRCMMLAAGVNLKSRDHAFALVDFVQDNPHLKPYITAITVKLADFPPLPLLRILSDLSDIKFVSEQKTEVTKLDFQLKISPSLHPSTFSAFRLFGSHIHTLRLFHITFSTPLELAHLLLAFRRSLTHLVCDGVTCAQLVDSNDAPLAAVKKRLSKHLRLRSLVSDSWCLKSQLGFEEMRSVGDVLLDPNFKLASYTMESLEITDNDSAHLRLPEWPQLRHLRLHLNLEDLQTRNSINILENVNSAVCKDVVIQFDEQLDLRDLQSILSNPPAMQYTDLGHVLLKFSQVTITWSVIPLCANRHVFWTQELKNRLTTFFPCNASLVLKSETVFTLGHDSSIHALAVSPDGKWIASGSDDSTIILWDTQDGSIAQQWTFRNYEAICSLAFSPDSRYLVVGGERRARPRGKMAVWDLSGNAHMLRMLERPNMAMSCAWSPDGAIIAALEDFSSCLPLLDATSFIILNTIEVPHFIGFYGAGVWSGPEVMFSSDGALLTCSGTVVSGSDIQWAIANVSAPREVILTNSFDSEHLPVRTFNLVIGNTHPPTRTASAPFKSNVQFLNIQVNERPLESEEGKPVASVTSFYVSPNGNLALAASSDGRVKVWDVTAGAVELWELIGHKGSLGHCMAHFSPSGKYIASAWEGNASLLWRVSDGMCVAELPPVEVGQCVTHFGFSPDENTLSFAVSNGTVQIHNIPDMISRYSQGR